MTGTMKRKSQELLKELQRRAGSWTVKRADELESEKAFEDLFSNLCFAIQQETDPQLSKYVLGFQLLKKSDDERRAFGVIGMEINGRIVLAPFFFIDGEIFGNELLWIADANMFVPKTPEWVSYIASSKESALGEPLPQDVRPALQPTLRFLKPYFAKMAEWVVPHLPNIADAILHPPEWEGVAVEKLMRTKSAAETMLRIVSQHPRLRLSPRIEQLTKIAKHTLCNSSIFDEKPIKLASDDDESSILEIYYDIAPDDPNFTLREKMQFRRKGYLIRDWRTRFTKVATVEEVKTVARRYLRNPNKTGVYEVRLDDSGDLHKSLVILCRMRRTGRVLYDGTIAYILPMEGPFAGETFKAEVRKVLASGGPGTDQEIEAALARTGKKLESQDDLPEQPKSTSGAYKPSPKYLIVTPARQVIYDCEVRWGPHSTRSITGTMEQTKDEYKTKAIRIEKMSSPYAVEDENDIFVPAGSYLVQILKPEDGEMVRDLPRAASDILRLPGLGTNGTVLKVVRRGQRVTVGDSQPMESKAAVGYLTAVHGLSEKDAERLLKRADKEHYWVLWKEGAEIPLAGRRISSPGLPDQQPSPDGISSFGLPAVTNVETRQLVPGLKELSPPLKTPPYQPIDPKTIDHINKAIQQGQKEILDTSVFAAVLSETNDQELIDKHIPHLLRSMDSVARMLFALYWHKDKFTERFGEYDTERLRNMLTGCFKQLGDLLQILQEKKNVNITQSLPEGIGEFDVSKV